MMPYTLTSTSKSLILLLVFIACLHNNSISQVNLVPNSSFEAYTICPKIAGTPAPMPNFWNATPIKGIQFFNTCANVSAPPNGIPYNELGSYNNYQPSHTGNSYCGFVALNTSASAGKSGGKRHYIQAKLTDSLKKGKIYSCGFYVALSNGANYGCNNIAMCITKNALTVDTAVVKSWVINANPQIYNYGNPIIKDTQNWTVVQSVFSAQGGEQYITIGNFKDNTNTSIDRYLPPDVYDWAVYMLDDVFVHEINTSYCVAASAGKDTAITIGDSVFIGSYTNGIDTIKWLNQNTGNKIDSTRPGFWVHPLVNTCYTLTQTVNGYTSSDTVCVTVKPLPLRFISYALRQAQGDKPSSLQGTKQSVENLWATANEINVSHFNIQRSINGKDFETIGSIKAQNKSYNEYQFTDDLKTNDQDPKTLYYRIESIDKDGRRQYSEVRNVALGATNMGIRIYPNPAKEVVNIDCVGMKEVNIINELGQIVYKQIATGTNLRNDAIIINTKNFNKGLFIVQIITKNKEVKNGKLMVE